MSKAPWPLAVYQNVTGTGPMFIAHFVAEKRKKGGGNVAVLLPVRFEGQFADDVWEKSSAWYAEQVAKEQAKTDRLAKARYARRAALSEGGEI